MINNDLENMFNEETDLVEITIGKSAKLYTTNKKVARLSNDINLVSSLDDLPLYTDNWKLIDAMDVVC